MSERAFEPIYPNPYIAGNPIRNQEMFFGRLDEFNFIARSLEDGRKTALIVLFGERRSGKSSILYQILNGRLGEAFLPIFVDMQLMAGISSDAEFFGRIMADACKQLSVDGISAERYMPRLHDTTATHVFREFLQDLKSRFPERAPLLLIDEYEFLEAKIKEGSLSRHLLTFFAGMLETDQVSFVFTGSKSLEAHDQELWGAELFRKATSRKISFLTRDDTARLITRPVHGKVSFTPETIAHIYLLTAGQPFYTQMICQNLVYHLNEVRKSEVEEEDVQAVIDGILENPPPQLLFNWNEQSAERKLTLSALAEFSESPETFLSARELCHKIKRGKLGVDLDLNFFNTELSALHQDEYVLHGGRRYCFRMDLYRLWVRHDHNIWRVKKEIGPHELARITKERRKKTARIKQRMTRMERGLLFASIIAAVILAAYVWDLSQAKVVVTANGGPFTVWVNGDSIGTTKGADDSTRFEMPEKLIKDSLHKFKLVLLASGEAWENSVMIEDNDQEVIGKFSSYPLTVVSDAASMEARLGQAKPERNETAWQQTFEVCAGAYVLKVKDRNTGETQDTVIAIPAASESLEIDFERVVVIALQAEFPFEYRYKVRDKKGKGSSTPQTAKLFSEIIRGGEKGTYQFTFTNPRGRGESQLEKYRITTDTVITVPPWKSPPPPPPRALTHLLQIKTSPDRVEVILNHQRQNELTPFFKNLSKGDYWIELAKTGYDTLRFGISLEQEMIIDTTLTAQYGYLKVEVNDEQRRAVSDAKVYIDEDFKGETPEIEEKLFKLQAGEHQIRVEHSGESVRKSFFIQKYGTNKIIITLRGKRG
jgi:hypothetical protein